MEYKSLDTFLIKGRGRVFVVENDKDRDNNDLLGSEVTIDGVNYKVCGVESFAMQKIAKGVRIGLLVN